MRKTALLALLLCVSLLLAACADRPAADGQETTKQTTGGEPAQTTAAEIPAVPVTDPAELEALWREYFYDSIFTIGNAPAFSSPAELDPDSIAAFCFFKYVREHGEGDLETAEPGTSLKLLPLETVLAYAERYFNITQLDTSKLGSDLYDAQRQAFIISFGVEPDPPAYDAPNAWGVKLSEVKKSEDGTLTAVLSHTMTAQNGITERTETYVLKQRGDKSLYFVSGDPQYIDNRLVSVSGAHRRFNGITGFSGRLETLSMLGEQDGLLLLACTPYQSGQKPALLLVDPATMKAEKTLPLDADFASTDVSAVGKDILICLADKIIASDRTLTKTEIIPLPDVIKNKISREVKYDERGIPDIFFGGYDLSADRKSFAYSDETGLWLYSIADGKETLLVKTEPLPEGHVIDRSFHRSPRFVAGGTRVITTMTDYEGTLGYTVCDIQSKKSVTHRISGEASSSAFIRYDTGILEPEAYIPSGESGTYKPVYLDFKKNTVAELAFESGASGFIRMPYSYYTGQNHAVFYTSSLDSNDPTKSEYTLHRFKLSDLKPEPGIITVRAAEPHILGVLSDGRTVFWYSLNPAETGICITK